MQCLEFGLLSNSILCVICFRNGLMRCKCLFLNAPVKSQVASFLPRFTCLWSGVACVFIISVYIVFVDVLFVLFCSCLCSVVMHVL